MRSSQIHNHFHSVIQCPFFNLISDEFIPALFGCKITPLERRAVGLPARFGGLGIPNLAQLADQEYQASISVTKKLVADMNGVVEEMPTDDLKF